MPPSDDELRATTEQLTLLVAEVRRLRGDEWLEKAVKEFDDDGGESDLLLAILRKHRDGSAR